jgi:hypothetical protein
MAQNDLIRWNTIWSARIGNGIAEISRRLSNKGVVFIVFKGFVAASCYPPQITRPSSDIDIAVDPHLQPAVMAIVAGGVNGITIDVHGGFRQLDQLSWEEHISRSKHLQIEDEIVRVPCPEDHLRIVATHWLNDGGVNKERLWDILYSVENRSNDFDWSKCLDCVSGTRRGWVITTIGLAHKYLGLNIDDLPFRDEALRIPKWVTDTLEREWAIEEPIRPLQTCTRDPKLFLRQLKRRIPPNPIQATIQMEAPIDDRRRTMIQLRNVIRRAGPSVERISSVLRGRFKRASK